MILVDFFVLVYLLQLNEKVGKFLAPYLFKFSIMPGIVFGQWYRYFFDIGKIEQTWIFVPYFFIWCFVMLGFAAATIAIYLGIILRLKESLYYHDYRTAAFAAISLVVICSLHVYLAMHTNFDPYYAGSLQTFI